MVGNGSGEQAQLDRRVTVGPGLRVHPQPQPLCSHVLADIRSRPLRRARREGARPAAASAWLLRSGSGRALKGVEVTEVA